MSTAPASDLVCSHSHLTNGGRVAPPLLPPRACATTFVVPGCFDWPADFVFCFERFDNGVREKVRGNLRRCGGGKKKERGRAVARPLSRLSPCLTSGAC